MTVHFKELAHESIDPDDKCSACLDSPSELAGKKVLGHVAAKDNKIHIVCEECFKQIKSAKCPECRIPVSDENYREYFHHLDKGKRNSARLKATLASLMPGGITGLVMAGLNFPTLIAVGSGVGVFAVCACASNLLITCCSSRPHNPNASSDVEQGYAPLPDNLQTLNAI